MNKDILKNGTKVSIPYYFNRINGVIKGYNNGFYKIDADGKNFGFIERDKIEVLKD